jgi:hypothetical protein
MILWQMFQTNCAQARNNRRQQQEWNEQRRKERQEAQWASYLEELRAKAWCWAKNQKSQELASFLRQNLTVTEQYRCKSRVDQGWTHENAVIEALVEYWLRVEGEIRTTTAQRAKPPGDASSGFWVVIAMGAFLLLLALLAIGNSASKPTYAASATTATVSLPTTTWWHREPSERGAWECAEIRKQITATLRQPRLLR